MESSLQNITASNSTSPNLEFNIKHLVSNVALFIMAIVPIYIGAIRSHFTKKSSEIVTTKDAAAFPFIASGALLSIYAVIKFLPMSYINFLIKLHFSIVGTGAMTRLLAPLFYKYIPSCVPNYCFKLEMSQSLEEKEASSESKWKLIDKMDFSFQTKDLAGFLISVSICAWYLFSGHWIANNCVALTMAVLAIEIIRLNKFINAVILLCGLFIYDVFWVFGTSVMINVAKNLEAPVKVIFPRDFLENGIFGKEMALLGLGDIVIPGLVISLLFRFDQLNSKGSNRTYFLVGYFAYIFSLVLTFVMMYWFKHAQPALLYMVPCCLGFPFLAAVIKKDIGNMIKYEDGSNSKEESKKTE